MEKNKTCKVPAAKRAEIKLLESFGEASPVTAAADLEATANSKLAAYLQMFSQPLTVKAIEAMRVLAGVKGKAKIDLTALGFTAADLDALGKEVAVV